MRVKIKEFLGSLGWVILAFMTLYSITFSCSQACEINKNTEKIKNERIRQSMD